MNCRNLDLGASTGIFARDTKTGNKKTPRKRTSALHYTRRRHASFVPGSCASGGVTSHGEERQGEMRGRGRTEGRVRCKWEAGAEGTAWINTIMRGWLTTHSPRQRGWEATRDNHPFACHRNYTLPTLDLVYHADFLFSFLVARSVLLSSSFSSSLDTFQIFGSRNIYISRC